MSDRLYQSRDRPAPDLRGAELACVIQNGVGALGQIFAEPKNHCFRTERCGPADGVEPIGLLYCPWRDPVEAFRPSPIDHFSRTDRRQRELYVCDWPVVHQCRTRAKFLRRKRVNWRTHKTALSRSRRAIRSRDPLLASRPENTDRPIERRPFHRTPSLRRSRLSPGACPAPPIRRPETRQVRSCRSA